MKPVRFRQSGAVWVVALVAAFGSVPLAATRWYLYWLPLVPLLVMVWGLRSGTEAGPDGITVRALFGRRRVAWEHVVAVGSPDGRRVLARLDNDTLLPLTAVTPADLPRLVEASGQRVVQEGPEAAGRPRPGGPGTAQ